jgi:hypothetical protein
VNGSRVLPERVSTHSPAASILYRRTSFGLEASVDWVSNCTPLSMVSPSEEYNNYMPYALLVTSPETGGIGRGSLIGSSTLNRGRGNIE